jgi:hypothetical protein
MRNGECGMRRDGIATGRRGSRLVAVRIGTIVFGEGTDPKRGDDSPSRMLRAR